MKRSITLEQQRETEANLFAMCLLMPEEWLRADVQRLCPDGFDFESDPAIQELAKRYQVSKQLMLIRLHQLGLNPYR